MNAKWSVLALFQGSAARVTAVDFCDALVQRFWPTTTFELSWFDWEQLYDASAAASAARAAKDADLLLIAAGKKGTLEQHLSRWLEASLPGRGEREGILAGLCAESAAAQQFLRKLAHQNGMDFLTDIPASLCQSVPENSDACTLRATTVTSVLDTILHQIPPPPRVL